MVDSVIRVTNAGGGADDDGELGDGAQCSHQQHKNAVSGGGICAFCLQEKLGNLVSSSSSSFVGASSSASSLSFRSDPSTAAGATIAVVSSSSTSTNNRHCREGEDGCCSNDAKTTRKARIPFLSSQKKKKVMADNHRPNLALRRSNSTATPRRNPYLPTGGQDYFNKRGGFWSFLYPSKPKSEKPPPFSNSSSARDLKPPTQPASTSAPAPAPAPEDKSADKSNSETTSFGRRVSRSRSVGCGSRHTPSGLGDCTLRRVESQREGSAGDISEGKVLCGGIFSGFMMASSSYLAAAEEHHISEKGSTAAVYGRSKSWGWALASPMRVFGKPASSSSSSTATKDVKTTGNGSKSNPAPNLAAIPSLLTARG